MKNKATVKMSKPGLHRLAKTLLEIAAALEHAEEMIKQQILKAAHEGDMHRVKAIVRKWLNQPVADVLDQEPADDTDDDPRNTA